MNINREKKFCNELLNYCNGNPNAKIYDVISYFSMNRKYEELESFKAFKDDYRDDEQKEIGVLGDLHKWCLSTANRLSMHAEEDRHAEEEKKAEKEGKADNKGKKGSAPSNIISSEFKANGLIEVLYAYLRYGKDATEEVLKENPDQPDQEPSTQFTINSKTHEFSYEGIYSSKGIESLSWSEWQHETRSAVVFQKLKLLGYSWEINTKKTFAIASCLSNLLGEDKCETESQNGQTSDKNSPSLPAVRRILLVHKGIAKSPEAQEIFSAFVISVLHESADCDWIDVRYAASAEEAYQRLQEEAFDCVLICPIPEEDSAQNLYSNVSDATLLNSIKAQVNVKYISDRDTDIRKVNTEGNSDFLVTHIGQTGNENDRGNLINGLLGKSKLAWTPNTNGLSGTNEADQMTNTNDSNHQAENKDNELLKQLITYYRVFPYDIFFVLLKKENPALPDRFNLWIYVCNGNLYYSTQKPDENKGENAIFLSPVLHQTKNLESLARSKVENSESSENQVNSQNTNTERFSPLSDIDNLYQWSTKTTETGKTIKVTSSKHEKINNLIAAATPLTGVSAIGHEHAIQVLCDKVKALLDGPFEQVVLKTVYQDYMNDDEDSPAKTIHWPELQAQSHHRARCLRSREQTRTLWNTGKTALESLTPEMMGKFVTKIQDNSGDCEKYASRIIISLGSKFPQENQKGKVYRTHQPVFHREYFKQDVQKVWEDLYESVFGGKPTSTAPANEISTAPANEISWVEINVRHYLRECVAFHLGGNEYLSPAKVDEHFTGNYTQMLEEFVCWLEVVNDVATKWKKKVLLKLPFRGDLLHFLNEIITFFNYKCKAEEDGGIKGITLINAFKSAISENQAKLPFSPAWYGMTNAWGDAADKRWKYQMSGELLNASRNELLYAVVKAICKTDMELHISGGVVSQDDITFLQKMVMEINLKKTPKIQIGTWGLIDLNLSKSTLDNSCAKDAASDGNGRPFIKTSCTGKCHSCKGVEACKHGAFTKQADSSPTIDYSKCKNCKQCIGACPSHNIAATTGLVETELEIAEYSWIKTEKIAEEGYTQKPEFIKGSQECKYVKYSKAIQPRIAFWLHDLCNGCGKCSRTFYCDSFLDRRGLDGPPVMDTRNCTGCGLCVQTCPQGAIQMFEPKHYAILLSNDDNALMEWRQFLTAEQIPHLVYTKQQLDDAWKYFDDEAKKQNCNDVIQWRSEKDLCKEMYGKDGYKDDRKAEVKEIENFINEIKNNELLKLWYSLALSDPGQILKESPVILVEQNQDGTTMAHVYTYESLSPKQSSTNSTSTDAEKQTKENESEQTAVKTTSSELEQTPESIRKCEALEEIRLDVAKRLSNLREEKR